MRKLKFFSKDIFCRWQENWKKFIFQKETGLSTVYKIFWILSELGVKSKHTMITIEYKMYDNPMKKNESYLWKHSTIKEVFYLTYDASLGAQRE